MDWTSEKNSAFDLDSENEKTDQLNRLVSETRLLQISQKISQDALIQINDYRNRKHLKSCKWDSFIQAGANLRGKEILTTPENTRPNGKEGMDAPYDFGYPKQKIIQLEIFTSLASNSLKWLIQNGGKEIIRLFLQSAPDFLIEDDSTEHAVGVTIIETPDNYFLGAVYLAGKEPKHQKVILDRSRLVDAYNHSNDLDEWVYPPDLWGKMMLVKAEAMAIYQKEDVTQKEIDQITKKLVATITALTTK